MLEHLIKKTRGTFIKIVGGYVKLLQEIHRYIV
jgi:hypothetical protein